MIMSVRSWWAFVLFVALLGAGCGGRPASPKTVPVSGKITLDGKPLANADVSFTPLENKVEGQPPFASSGKTDEQGNYTLKLDIDGKDGAVPGSHRVRVSIFDRGGDGKGLKGQLIPSQYNTESTLQFSVPDAGTTSADFPLSTKQTAPSRGPGR